MFATDFCPGPTNQKSVPGPWHEAVAIPPAAVCSASKACAMDPLAWIITPPRVGPVGTAEPTGDSRAILASPVPVEAAASATSDAVAPDEPGAGQARTAAVTAARAA